MEDDAIQYKERGNDAFKAGKLAEAVALYSKAEEAEPSDPIYPSNLSAALYEIGDYAGVVEAVSRAWRPLQSNADAKPDLTVRLSTRLAKALCYGLRTKTLTPDGMPEADMKGIQTAASEKADPKYKQEHAQAWKEWMSVQSEMNAYATGKGDACMIGLSRLPLFCKPLTGTKEFFYLGTDDVIDLVGGWGPGYAYPLDLDALSEDRLSQLAFLFGGVGDGRHVFSTLSGLHIAVKRLSPIKQAQFRVHLTLLDIHDATIARDLCLMMLLHDLTHEIEPVGRTEIKATLMYAFCGVIMPAYCHDRLQWTIRSLHHRLSSSPPDMPTWLHVDSETIPHVLRTLEYWMKATKSTEVMLEKHQPLSDSDNAGSGETLLPGGANPEFKRQFEANVQTQRADIKDYLLTMPEEDLVKWDLIPEGATIEDAREFIKDNIEKFVTTFYNLFKNGKSPSYEEYWYKDTKVFLPPKELRRRHPGFDRAWKQVNETGYIDPDLQKKIVGHIEQNWKPNITLFDLKCADPLVYSDGDGYPDLRLDMFGMIGYLDQWNRRNGPHAQDPIRSDPEMLAWRTCNMFFEETAAAIKALSSSTTIEFICSGLAEELTKMRYKGDVTRPQHFPRTFTRMWLSNVPDYTHGPMNMIVFCAPNLQDDPQAAAACNSMYNVAAWAGDEEFIHTYTLLLPDEIPRYLACPIIDSRAVMDVFVVGPQSYPRPLSELATREELLTWLTRILFNIFIPGHSKFRPYNIRLPHNLVAFFGLLMHLQRVGYPAHWLTDFLTNILKGRMYSDIRPYDDFYPIPVTERTRRVEPRWVRTDPWLVEFKTIIATAYYAIPFPISNALPADFTHDPDDIAVWEVRVRPAQIFSTRSLVNFSSPLDPRTQLLFFRTDVTNQTVLIDQMQRIFEGRDQPSPGTFFVLTAQEHVEYQECVRFRLSKTRVERMRKEKWSMVAYRNDTGQQATLPEPIHRWILFAEDTGSTAGTIEVLPID